MVGLSLCLPAGHTGGPAKTGEPIEVPFRVWTWLGPRNHYYMGDMDPQGEGAIFGGRAMWPEAAVTVATRSIDTTYSTETVRRFDSREQNLCTKQHNHNQQ